MREQLKLDKAVKTGMHKESADLHTKTASALYGIECQDVTREQRQNAKAFNYGRLYSMSTEDTLTFLEEIRKCSF